MKRFFIMLICMLMSAALMLTACGKEPDPTPQTPPVPPPEPPPPPPIEVVTDTWDGSVDTSWYTQGVTEFELTTSAQLAGLAALVNEGNSFYDVTVTLTSNLVLSQGIWTPIGTATRSGNAIVGNSFDGTFIGNGLSVSGMVLADAQSSDAIGLFGAVTGRVMGINVKATTVTTASKNVGLIAGLLKGGSIENCSSDEHCSVTAPDGVGGLIGRVLLDGNVSGCTNRATVCANEAGNGTCGGIISKAYYSAEGYSINVSECSNSGEISGTYAAAGIIGFSSAYVTACVNEGEIYGRIAGGIAGEQIRCGIIESCTNFADITIENGVTAGGIVGFLRYHNSDADYQKTECISIINNFNHGNIIAVGSLGGGGIVGTIYNQAIVTGNTNTCAVITAGTFAAGIAAILQISNDNKIIEEENIVVTENRYSLDTEITASCVDEVAYKNDPKFEVYDNESI